MNINPKILQILEKNFIKIDDALPYLLSLYFNYNPSYIPDSLKIRLHTTGIIKVSQLKFIEFTTPLFLNENIPDKFDWVFTEYRLLFKHAENLSGKRSNKNYCLKKMKEFFANNPDVRKQEVIEATKMYISQTDPKFTRRADYFIYKQDIHKNVLSDLSTWIEVLRDQKENKIIIDDDVI